MNKGSFSSLLQNAIASHRQAIDALADTLGGSDSQLERIANIWNDSLVAGGRIIFVGNGGSAADAQHLAAELVVRFRKNRPALPGLALTTDTSVLTACANDLGFEKVFARQIEAFGRSGDVLVAISTSGKSPNILKAAQTAREMKLKVIVFCGRAAGPLQQFADAILAVPSEITAHIQECHMICGHALCEWVEQNCPCP
ncbi:MAG: phosphoheptose isomerase [Verrucomicrobia bacterium]|nr:MAG: phosphoheptose isomerase [Verrucomicrobiota bacterium]